MLSLPEEGSRAGFRNTVLHLKLDDGQISKKERWLPWVIKDCQRRAELNATSYLGIERRVWRHELWSAYYIADLHV